MNRVDHTIILLMAAAACAVSPFNLKATEAGLPSQRIFRYDRLNNYIPGNDTTCNYVSVAVLHNPGASIAGSDSMTVSTEYFDGLGRHTRTAVKDASAGKVIVSSGREYDAMGRVVREYLPFKGNSANAGRVSLSGAVSAEYGSGGAYGFTAYGYSARLSNGKVTVNTPGEAWHTGAGRTEATSVYTPGDLKLFHLTPDGELAAGNYYGAGELLVTTSVDEEGNRQESVRDLSGTLLRTVTYPDASTPCVTDYLYNLYGQLVCILTPPAYDQVCGYSDGEIPYTWRDDIYDMAYFYEYDKYGRMSSKKVPGADRERFIYDYAGRLVYSQDGNLGDDHRVRFYCYDNSGRPVMDGTVKWGPMTVWNLVAEQNASAFHNCDLTDTLEDSFYGYVNCGITGTDTVCGSVTYYDTYDFLELYPALKDSLTYENRTGFSEAFLSSGGTPGRTGHLPTGIMTFDTDGANPEMTVFYYDAEGRVVQTRKYNRLGGYNIVHRNLRGDGVVLSELRRHSAMFKATRPFPPIKDSHTDYYEYTYDRAGNVTLITLKHDADPVQILEKSSYGSLGRLSLRHYGNPCKLGQSYRYTMRGELDWLGGGQFAETLHHQTRRDGSAGFLNGKISGISWRMWENTGLTDRNYEFDYDGAGRLTAAIYKDYSADGSRGNVELVNAPDFSEYYTWDKFGNLKSLRTYGLTDRQTLADGGQRYTYGLVKGKSFRYSGAQMTIVLNNFIPVMPQAIESSVTGTGPIQQLPTAEYDRNGNLTKSLFPSVRSMSYDINNRLRRATSRQTVGEATWDYSVGHLSGADGVLRRSTYYYGRPDDTGSAATVAQRALSNGSALIPGFGGRDSIFTEQPLSMHERTIEYCGDYRYDYIGMLTSPEVTLQFPQGYRDTDGWHFYLRDHLGSVRLVCSPDCAVEEFYHYYPYGEPMAESSYGSFKAQRFTGKESDTWLGVSLIDNDARFKLGMGTVFNSVDRLADNTPGVSPYLFCGGDPINHTDPTGLVWVKREVEGMTQYFYARNVHTISEFKEKYGYDEGIELVKTGIDINVGEYKIKFFNDLENDIDGRFSVNGILLNPDGIKLGDGFAIGGTDDKDLDLGTLYRNLMGTHYTGPLNPLTNDGSPDYSTPVKYFSEIGSKIHDKMYDAANAAGLHGALIDNRNMVVGADLFLATHNLFNLIYNPNLIDKGRSLATSVVFFLIVEQKLRAKMHQSGFINPLKRILINEILKKP